VSPSRTRGSSRGQCCRGSRKPSSSRLGRARSMPVRFGAGTGADHTGEKGGRRVGTRVFPASYHETRRFGAPRLDCRLVRPWHPVATRICQRRAARRHPR
jgi:hypothetical protein